MKMWHGVIILDVHEMSRNMNWLYGCAFGW